MIVFHHAIRLCFLSAVPSAIEIALKILLFCLQFGFSFYFFLDFQLSVISVFPKLFFKFSIQL